MANLRRIHLKPGQVLEVVDADNGGPVLRAMLTDDGQWTYVQHVAEVRGVAYDTKAYHEIERALVDRVAHQ
jgi:hypothetical protein